MKKFEELPRRTSDGLIPHVMKASTKDFSRPPTVESDFKRHLYYEKPHENYWFVLLHNWYDQYKAGYEPLRYRGQWTSIDWKSKVGNSDMATNLKVSHDVAIEKGDMVIRDDGEIFLVNWDVQEHPNNYATQTAKCNTYLTITRERQEITDDRGYLVIPSGLETIVDHLPVIHIEYQGRPDYMKASNQPGVNADHIITVTCQWNEQTRNIRIDDEFPIGVFTYRVVNVAMTEVFLDEKHGILTLNAKRVAGGGIVG